ncbi:transcriptional regulator [Rhizobium sp. NZLR3b]|uniref:transcriptional regulator n=1 Tax=Rhizobium sp. NZLR3b TaxID=2731101 RepID=UPI001C82A608|nr:transcriptional regulator [Rhizobium sp. NZLR3b]MBX5192613.1 transcriptional regulator [Rhizobium sp. NZLR3b]
MKKVQRSFAVEYKSGRRKTDPKANSIWGNMDLKSVARDVEEEAMPFLSGGPQEREATGEVPFPASEQAGPLLTLPLGQETTASALKETMMADESNTMTNTNAPAVVETEFAPKKQRKPRAKKAAPETVLAEVTAEPTVASGVAGGRQKRGRKSKSVEAVSSAKRAPVKRATRPAQTVTMAPMAAGDEMADLLQLEQENQRLRKLLAEQLRTENADLRKRLKLD